MSTFTLALSLALAVILVVAAVGDWRTRTIPNWLTAGIALAAPLWWYAHGWPVWPGVAMQVGLALGAFVIFAAMFAIGAMGGGDVKLIAALALWFPLVNFMLLLVAMAVAGGVLTIGMLVRHKLTRAETPLEVPYGIAIAGAGVWSICRTIS